MIWTLTARRLTAGSYDAFRAAWDPGAPPPGWSHVYHCRDVENPDVVLSFGLFEGTLGELRDAQPSLGREAQVDRVVPHVDEVLLDRSFEVVENLS